MASPSVVASETSTGNDSETNDSYHESPIGHITEGTLVSSGNVTNKYEIQTTLTKKKRSFKVSEPDLSNQMQYFENSLLMFRNCRRAVN